MMQLSFFTVIVALAVGSAVAIPTHVVDSNVGAGPVGVANLGGSNAAGSNVAGSNLGAVVVGAAAHKADQLGRRKQTQPEYIASPQTSTDGSCTVGQAQCCQSLHQTQELASQGLIGQLLAADIPIDQLMVGIQCTPLANLVPIAGGASTCNSKPVCCSSNKYDGLVSVGCSPLSLGS